jgi:copper chaperone NosL
MSYWRHIATFILLTASLAGAAEPPPVKPAATDKCPVCGMFVAKYPDFLVQIVFKDGSRVFFDGTKDMMKYYLALPRYNPAKSQADIAAVMVTDYYSLSPIDGFKAFYVYGSNVYGPMGKELIPFKGESEAKEFLRDHRGQTILRFGEISENLLKVLDQ